MKKSIIYILIIFLLSVICCNSFRSEKKSGIARKGFDNTYYIDGRDGSDDNPGTIKRPLKSIKEINLRLLKKPADICFAGGQI